ncbi:MAG: OprO/OprP family phosphate-selective porin [Muribaculaceae bacterium]|nr:OprO/OprP family phosphate-selective porin [Muribaculaceae bacterium]
MCKKLILTAIYLLSAVSIAVAGDSIDYRPKFHGAVRSRWEMETQSGESRFQVRYARLTMDGNIAPAISYFVQTDLCDKGKMKILDAFGKYSFRNGIFFQAGQFRMPFGVETFMAPQNYIFANRSFMGKQMCNYRKVGAKVGYKLPLARPLLLEAGIFNNASIADQEEWSKSYSYSGQATFTFDNVTISAGALSIKPEEMRMNMYDVALSWSNSRLKVAGEFMTEHYCDDGGLDNANSYCVYADYRLPIDVGIFNQWSIQGRFDGISNFYDEDEYSWEMFDAKRITLGTTFTYKYKSVFSDIRFNWEKYLYPSGVEVEQGLGDKIVVELVVRF